ncbi:hypothetical protein RB195_021828 [Necator americanus]|uniref:Uncharacterized protein n=1 Tax=Necator americanus TaxID=51031 RepID=A0ABR1ECS7_NECAM
MPGAHVEHPSHRTPAEQGPIRDAWDDDTEGRIGSLNLSKPRPAIRVKGFSLLSFLDSRATSAARLLLLHQAYTRRARKPIQLPPLLVTPSHCGCEHPYFFRIHDFVNLKRRWCPISHPSPFGSSYDSEARRPKVTGQSSSPWRFGSLIYHLPEER